MRETHLSDVAVVQEMDFCRAFGIHRSTLIRWQRKGIGPTFFTIGGKHRYIILRDLARWLEERKAAGDE